MREGRGGELVVEAGGAQTRAGLLLTVTGVDCTMSQSIWTASFV